METSGFFNAMENADGSYDRTYIAEQFAKFFSMFIGNGVFASPQNQLKVVAKENLTVTIKKGFAFIDGYWYYNDSDLDVDITPNATANKRVDGIFVTLDKTERTITHTYEVGRTNRIVNGSVSELKIAEVTVEVGVAVLSDAKIKDTRADNSVCGFVTGIIDVIETDDLFLQFETQFNEWFNSLDNEGKKILSDFITESDALLESFTNDKDEALNNFSVEINEWFESIKGKMSKDDIAVSLQLQVDDLRTDTDENTLKIGNLTKQVDLFDIIMSTDYTLPNSKQGGYRLTELVGATEQKTIPGNQLFDASKLTTASAGGVTVTNNGDGSFTVSGSGKLSTSLHIIHTYTHDETIKLLKTGLLYFRCEGVATTPYAYIQLKNDTGVIVSMDSYIPNVSYEVTKDMIDDISFVMCIGFYAASTGVTIVPGTIKPMLYQDGDGTWEPFVGGTPSPNSDYPQVIENTFDCVEMIQGYRNGDTGVYTSSSNYVCDKYPKPCKSGDTVKVVCNNAEKIYIVGYREDGTVATYQTMADNGITISSNVVCFTINLYNANGLTPETIGKVTLTVNGKYVGQIVEHGKNILGGLKFANALPSPTIDSVAKTVTVKSDSIGSFSYANFKENTQYTFFLKGYNSAYETNGAIHTNMAIRYTDGTRNELRFDSNGNVYYVSTAGKTIERFVGVHYGYYTIFNYEECGVFEGVVALEDFEPYTEKVATFLLNEPLRATDRLVRKDGVIGENHKRGSVDLGTFSWTLINDTFWRANAQSDMLARGNNYKSNIIAEKYLDIESNYIATPNGVGKIALMNSTSNEVKKASYIYCNNGSTTETPSGLFEYELVEETYTPLDTESQLALNDMVTFDGITYIGVDSKIPPTSISGEYGTSQVGAYTLENANLRDSEAILEKERNIVQRLSGVSLSSINGYIKAYCIDCTDIPVFDEGTNEGFYEQWQNDYGINMERYTVLNESGYGVGIYTRVNSVSWQKVSGNPADEIAWSEVVVSGSPTIVRIELPSGFTLDNCIIIASYFKKDNVELCNQIEGMKSDGSIQRDSLWYQKNIDANQYALWLSSLGVGITYNGTLRVYFQRIM